MFRGGVVLCSEWSVAGVHRENLWFYPRALLASERSCVQARQVEESLVNFLFHLVSEPTNQPSPTPELEIQRLDPSSGSRRGMFGPCKSESLEYMFYFTTREGSDGLSHYHAESLRVHVEIRQQSSPARSHTPAPTGKGGSSTEPLHRHLHGKGWIVCGAPTPAPTREGSPEETWNAGVG